MPNTGSAAVDTFLGSASQAAMRTNIGAAIGSDVQAYSALLAAIAALTPTDGNIIVGNGTTFVAESGATARTSLGLGSLATASTISNSNWSGTDLAVVNGGTGASDASGARTNLGLVIGTNVQAYSADLAAIAALAKTDGNIIVGNGSTWVAESGSTARTSLGLGSLATVSPTGTADSTTFLRGDGTWATPAGGGGSPGGSSGDIQYNSSGSFAGSLLKQDTNAIEQRDGVSSQALHVYHTYTDASNYERASIFFDSNQAILEAGYAGTGTARSVYFRTGANNRWGINSSGALFSVVNRGYDLGLSGNRVRTLFTTQMDCERYIMLTEFASPTTPSANSCSVYAKDNGAGKTQLVVRMPDGVETVLATET